jgi:Tol biopolymer transport system component
LGSGLVARWQADQNNGGPAWSPDGKRIAFSFGPSDSWGPEQVIGLAVIDRDGSHRHTILRGRGY